MNSQKLERMYVAALSAAEPGAETTKSTPIFLRNSDASKTGYPRCGKCLGHFVDAQGCTVQWSQAASIFSELKSTRTPCAAEDILNLYEIVPTRMHNWHEHTPGRSTATPLGPCN